MGGLIPRVILSHRRNEFLSRILGMSAPIYGTSAPVIVDDSGDPAHHQWLDDNGYQFSVVDPAGSAGYLAAMSKVFEVAADLADQAGVGYALLWEEDFLNRRPIDVLDLVDVMDHRDNAKLAHLNLQRQAVYNVERRFGYLESHVRRGYDLDVMSTNGHEWVRRAKPFTTNPGLIRREVLDIEWPTREEADVVDGGAEPAMSIKLQQGGWYFGWYGRWNQADTLHIGRDRKTGTGY